MAYPDWLIDEISEYDLSASCSWSDSDLGFVVMSQARGLVAAQRQRFDPSSAWGNSRPIRASSNSDYVRYATESGSKFRDTLSLAVVAMWPLRSAMSPSRTARRLGEPY
jgi:hypothetical protein